MPQDYNPQALSEFKRASLDSKIAEKQAGASAKLASIFGPSEAEVALNADVANLRQLAQQEYQATVQREDEAVLSDEAVESPLGYAANQTINLTGKVADVVIGQTSRLGINLADAYDDATIPTEDKERYKTIQDKQAAGAELNKVLSEMASKPAGTYTRGQIDEVRAQYESTQLTEEEEAFSNPNDQRDSTGTKSYKRLEEGKARETMREVMKQPFAQLEKWVNKGNKDKAVARVRDEVERAAIEFDDANYGEAVGTIFGAVGNLVTEDIEAAGELLIDSAAHMIALAKNAPVAITTIGSDMLSSSTKEFEKKHKRPAEPDEMAYMALLVYGSVGLDAVGAKVSLGASTGFKSLLNVGKKLDLKVPKSLVATATQLGKVTASAPGKAVKATVVEGVTESAQEILEGQAVSQDFSKVDVKQALVAGVIGAAIGGGMSAPSSAVQAADSIREGLNKASTKVIEAANKAGVGKTADVIVAAKENKDAAKGINEIKNTDFSTLSKEQQDALLNDFEEFITMYEADPKLDVDQLLKYESELNDIYDIVIDSRAEASVSEAVDTLEKGPSPEANETLVAHIRNSATISPVDVKRSLGSDSSFRDTATPEQLKVVEDLNDFNKAVSTARNIDNVTDNVLKGSVDSKFTGIETHMSNAKRAIRTGDVKAVNTVLSKLTNFLSIQNKKLNNKGNTPKFTQQIQNEVNLIEATIQQIKTLSGGVKAEAKPKAKPEVVAAKPKPKQKIEVKDLFEYKYGKPVGRVANIATLYAEYRKGKSSAEVAKGRAEFNKILAEIKEIQYTTLSKINITREEGEEAITFNAGNEFDTLTKRMSGLEQIWKECK
jgi:hypothetical protein